MKLKNMFSIVETHTVGQPTRTVIGGIPPIPGKTMAEKMLYLKEQKDWIRRIVTWEPRGSNIMSGVILTEPCSSEADFGAIYIEVGGYLPMCGHDTIGAATALVESGLVEAVEPYTYVTLDTPAGLVKVKIKVRDGVAKEVTFINIPSFVALRDGEVEVEGVGKITFDVAYGGNFYAIVKAEEAGLSLLPKETTKIIACGDKIRTAINEKYQIVHPEKEFIQGVTHVEFYGEAVSSKAHCRNAVVIPDGSLDRSPCGTGSSAKLALLYEKGELGIKEEFVHESIIGSLFRCRILGTDLLGNKKAVISEITGSAYVMGIHTLVLDPEDPFQAGFLLK